MYVGIQTLELPYFHSLNFQNGHISVGQAEMERKDAKVRVFHGRGRTLMSGLGDAQTHLTCNEGNLNQLGEVGVWGACAAYCQECTMLN